MSNLNALNANIMGVAGWDMSAALSTLTDDLVTKEVALRWVPRFDIKVSAIYLDCGTSPTGSSIIVDVKVNGTSMLTTLPEIADGGSDSVNGTPALINSTYEVIHAGDVVTFAITQIGSTAAGKNLNVTMLGNRIS